jgi:hypothetical protein
MKLKQAQKKKKEKRNATISIIHFNTIQGWGRDEARLP